MGKEGQGERYGESTGIREEVGDWENGEALRNREGKKRD